MKIFLKHVSTAAATAFLVTASLLSYYTPAFANEKLATYFQYHSSALIILKKSSSTYEMTTKQLQKWDTIMFDLVKEQKLSGIPAARIYAYVYTAQRDAAFLSKNIKHQYTGSLEPISSKVLCLFFPSDCQTLKKKSLTDAYSDQLADIVLEKIKSKIELEKKQTGIYPKKLTGKNYWVGIPPYTGHETGSAMTWLISSPNAFLPPPPPAPQSKEWQNQLKQTKLAVKNITPEQIKSIHYWAGTPGTLTSSGMWLTFANNYMDAKHTPLAKKVLVRSVLAMGIADAFIGVFHAKYTYWVKRPVMLDPLLDTVLPTPNHPSYPAGHSTLSATAATILTYYFPKKKQEWWQKANEASQGRVLGGIHFPIDTEQGLILGKKIGKAVVYQSFISSGARRY